MQEYFVQPEDTWESVAQNFGIPVEYLQSRNGVDPNQARPLADLMGGAILIPHIPTRPGNAIGYAVTQPTGEVTEPFVWITPDNMEDLEHVTEIAGLVMFDPSAAAWRDYGLIQQLGNANEIIGYDPGTDTYIFADGTTTSREDLVLAYMRQVAEQTAATSFDSEAVTRDFLYLYLMNDQYPGHQSANDKAGSLLLRQTAQLILNTTLPFSETPSLEAVIASLEMALGEGYTADDAAQLAYEVASQILNSQEDIPGINTQALASQLMNNANLFLLASQIDAYRQFLQSWDADAEAILLDQLRAQIIAMPLMILDIPVGHLHTPFQTLYDFIQRRRAWLINDIQPVIAYYEDWFQGRRDNLDAQQEMFTWINEVALSVLLEPVDWFLSIRDMFRGEMWAILGLIPLIPGSVSRLGRLFRNIGENFSVSIQRSQILDFLVHSTGQRIGFRFKSPKEVESLFSTLMNHNNENILTALHRPEIKKYLAQLGIHKIDDELIDSVKHYLFNHPYISFDEDNYNAWRRLQLGNGTVNDIRFIIHELVEMRLLESHQARLQKLGIKFNFNPRTTIEPSSEWNGYFRWGYEANHPSALEAEFKYIADVIYRFTGEKYSYITIAVNDQSRRIEALSHMLIDGRPLSDINRTVWENKANEMVQLSNYERDLLGWHSNEISLQDLITRIKGLQIKNLK